VKAGCPSGARTRSSAVQATTHNSRRQALIKRILIAEYDQSINYSTGGWSGSQV
jgi:hypothetical protein